MKIKRFFAPDIRQAIRMVREEQGPDAVILSNRKVDGGVEIVAARDFDERVLETKLKLLSPEAEAERSPALSETTGARPAGEKNGERAGIEMSPVIPKRPADSGKRIPPQGRPLPHTPEATRPAPSQVNPVRQRRNDIPSTPHAGASVVNAEFAKLRKEMREMRAMMDIRLSEFAWGTTSGSNPVRMELLRRLSACGFSKDIAFSLLNQLPANVDIEAAWNRVAAGLAKQIPLLDDNVLDHGGVIALVGPTGVGKTTTIAKLAARFRLKHGPRQIALVSTDNYRIAAHEQLTTYARILDVPVRTVHDADELRHALNYFIDKHLVLIDTAGIGQRDERLVQQFNILRNSELAVSSYLVMSAATQQKGLQEVVKAFGGFEPDACILTKLDEAATLGAAVSTLMEAGLPLAFVTNGQQVPEDLHLARSFDLLGSCFAPVLQGMEHSGPETGFDFEEWVACGYV